MLSSLLSPSPLPRALVICGDRSALDGLAALSVEFATLPLGVLLRDPQHRRAETLALLEHYHQLFLPQLWTPIANSWSGDVPWLHLTSAQLLLDNSDLVGLIAGHRLGASAHSEEEIERAVALGAEYLLVSPIYPTPSKPTHPGMGVDRLRDLCNRSPVPLFALGGVERERIAECSAAGAYGVATLSHVDREWLEAVAAY